MVELTAVVGLRREREVLTVALATGRHVVIEGPPGTGKSTLLRSIAADTGQEVVFVEGNAELTPARLVGQFDPSQVLAEGYRAEHFVDGPLITAMRQRRAAVHRGAQPRAGGDAQRAHHRAHRGRDRGPAAGHGDRAGKDFRLIAAMNPFDAVGTARVSAGHRRPDVPGRARLPGRARASGRSRPSVSGLAGRLGRALGRADPGHPRAPRRADGLVGARGDRPGAGADRPGRAARRAGPRRRLPGRRPPGRRLRRALGPHPDRRRRGPHARVGDRRAAGPSCGRPTRPTRPEPPDAEGKADSPSGAPRRASSPAPDRVASGRRRTHEPASSSASQHPAFDEVSPEVGELDAEAFDAAVAEDAEAAAAMLADMAVATDVALRAAARRLAGRVFLQLGRVGPGEGARAPDGSGRPAGWRATSTSTARSTRWTPSASRRPERRRHRHAHLDRAPPGGVPRRRHLGLDAGARGGVGRGRRRRA